MQGDRGYGMRGEMRAMARPGAPDGRVAAPMSSKRPEVGIASLTVLITGTLAPVERGERYDAPLRRALAEVGQGRITGAGRIFSAPEPQERPADRTEPSGEGEARLDWDAAFDADGPAEDERRYALTFIELETPDPWAALPTVLDCLRQASKGRAGRERVSLEMTWQDGSVHVAEITPLI
ncbi:MAG: hypothetical protein AAF909_13115 [Pseudomonadota bacterium]